MMHIIKKNAPSKKERQCIKRHYKKRLGKNIKNTKKLVKHGQ